MPQKTRRNSLYQGIQSFSINDLLNDEKLSFLIDKSLPREYYHNDFLLESYLRNHTHDIESQKILPINEMTLKEIRAGADAARLRRSKDSRITCHFQGVTSSQGLLKFMVTSQYTPGLKYMVHIKLKEAKDIKYFKEFNKRDIIRLLLSGDLQINCACPDFRYRFRYQAWKMGYGLYREVRYPKIANQKLVGSVCKHCLAVFRVLHFNTAQIAKAFTNSKFFKKKYKEE